MKRRKMVVVTWLDADSSGAWHEAEEVKKMTPQTTRSVGLLMRSDEDVVILAQTENSKHIGDCLIIPRGMVRRVRTLK